MLAIPYRETWQAAIDPSLVRQNMDPPIGTGMTTILGIETSCDETAAAIVSGDGQSGNPGNIRSNIVHSQIDEHAHYGGVVPEIAARAHVEKLDQAIARAMKEADAEWSEIDAIAATTGPGLIGGLIVGLMTAKAIASAHRKPLIAINHLEGHALTPRLTSGLAFPYLLLLVSGGHTQIVCIRSFGHYERWSTTIDDALGEAFDKTAKLLGLPYPGGPAVEKAATSGDPHRFDLPRPLKGSDRPDFSFSGLKTAIRQTATALGELTEADVADLCASFQQAITETLEERLTLSLQRFKDEFPGQRLALVVAGGVAANRAIRETLTRNCEAHGFDFYAPPGVLCTDNAAMIAWAGLEHFEAGSADEMTVSPRPRWPLDEISQPVVGHGRRGAKA